VPADGWLDKADEFVFLESDNSRSFDSEAEFSTQRGACPGPHSVWSACWRFVTPETPI